MLHTVFLLVVMYIFTTDFPFHYYFDLLHLSRQCFRNSEEVEIRFAYPQPSPDLFMDFTGCVIVVVETPNDDKLIYFGTNKDVGKYFSE